MKLTALQELENCALARMVDIYNGNVMTFDRTTQYKNIHKSLQALEIIKREPVETISDVLSFKDFDAMFRHYRNSGEFPYIKTEAEFNLLKEVLL